MSRAFASIERSFGDGPRERLFRCVECLELVESVDSHEHCGDCAERREDRDAAEADAHEREANERELAACPVFNALVDAHNDDAIEHQCAAEVAALATDRSAA